MRADNRIELAWGPGESRAALYHGDRLVELFILRGDSAVGSVYLGRVLARAGSIGAAFVEIGSERPGFLRHAEGVSDGDAVLVQVKAEARGHKGAVLTREVSFAGRWLAYSPLRPGRSLSRRLPEDERQRLSALLADLAEPGEGLVARTAAAGRGADEIAAELAGLRADWRTTQAARTTATGPTVVWRPDPLVRLLAEHPEVSDLRIDDIAARAQARARLGAIVGDGPVDRARLDEAIALSLDPVVPLPSGGRLVIGMAAALTAIDVDSGKGAPEAANREAVAEIARQIRLRGLSGQILVDFVPGEEGRKALYRLADALTRTVADDPLPAQVHGVSPMGIVELSRERRRPRLDEILCEVEWRPSARTLAFAALRQAITEAACRPGRRLALVAAPAVIRVLETQPGALREAETRIGEPLTLRADPARAPEDTAIMEIPR